MKSNIAKEAHFLLAFGILVSAIAVGRGAQVLNQPASQTTQSRERVIEKSEYEFEPLLVTLKVKGKDREVKEKFTESGDWIKGLSITIKNIQPKPIVFIVFILEFPETQTSSQPVLTEQIKIGQDPVATLNRGNSIFLKQDDVITWSLSDEEYTSLNSFLARKGHNTANLNRANVRVILVEYYDGTKWAFGAHFTPDPSSPTGFRKIKQ